MSRARRIAGVCLLLFFPSLILAQTDPGIALLYVEAAEDALAAGQSARADQLMQVAREFAPDSSDVLYMSASLDALQRGTTMRAIERARSALDNSSWVRYSASRGAVFLASLLNRVRRPGEAIAVLEATELTPTVEQRVAADYYDEWLVALYAIGSRAEADSLLTIARDRFPNDPRYFQFVLEGETVVSREHRLELERLMNVADSSDRESAINALLLEYAKRAPTTGERSWALSVLEDREWHDPRVALVILIDSPERAVSYFVRWEGFADLSVYLELLDRLESPRAAELAESVSSFSGWSERDLEADGLWNERARIESGMIVRWVRDLDQDGIPEVDVTFGPNEPTEVVFRDSSNTVILRYSDYPYLSEGELATELGREVFVLRPRTVRLDVMQPLASAGPAFDGESRVARSIRRVGPRELISASIRIDQVRPDGTIAVRTFNEAGTRSRILRDESGNGTWDHLMLTDGGFVVSGVRDIDGDGYHEVAEAYRNGRLIAVAIDSDDNGVPEVFEQYERLGSREWDINEDGRIDVREFSFWTDSVLREFPLADQEG